MLIMIVSNNFDLFLRFTNFFFRLAQLKIGKQYVLKKNLYDIICLFNIFINRWYKDNILILLEVFVKRYIILQNGLYIDRSKISDTTKR